MPRRLRTALAEISTLNLPKHRIPYHNFVLIKMCQARGEKEPSGGVKLGAKLTIEECSQIDPEFGQLWTEWWPYRPSEQFEHVTDGLRKAGWKG